MKLEKMVFDADGGIKVELRPELIVLQYAGSNYLTYVPVSVSYEGQEKEGGLVYDPPTKHFITPLTDFFPEAAACNTEVGSYLGRIYSSLLQQGGVKVREQVYDFANDQWVDSNIFPTFNMYQAEVISRVNPDHPEK